MPVEELNPFGKCSSIPAGTVMTRSVRCLRELAIAVGLALRSFD